jgi:hypothetical protein
MIYIFLITLGVLGIAGLLIWVMKKYNIKLSDLLKGLTNAKSVVTFLKVMARQMHFGTDEEIEKISGVIIQALDYMKTIPTDDSDARIKHGYEFTIEMCEDFGIELNEDQKYIVSTLITLGFNFIESLEKK